MAKLINMTPHPVNILDCDGNTIQSLPSQGTVRVSTTSKSAGDINGIPLVETVFGDIDGLPDAQDGTWLIVSRIVLAACPDRDDLVVPDGVVRDDNGRILGCTRFSR